MASSKTKQPNTGTKKKNAVKFKNILSQPIPQYWPEISEADTEDLNKNLLEIKSQQCNDQFDLKKFGITLGLNACMRKLNNGNISSVLISTDIKPKFIINQIIFLILSRNCSNIKLLCVPNFKIITHQIFGISSLVMVIDRQLMPSIENWISMKSENFPIPKEIIQYYNKQGDADESKIPEIVIEGKSEIQKKKFSQPSCVIINFNELYLKRPNDKSKRAFIPENGRNFEPLSFEIPKKNEPSTSWEGGDYISFSGKEESVKEIKKNAEDSKEDYDKDKIRLLKVFEKMNANLGNRNHDTKINEETDVEMKEEKGNQEGANAKESISVKSTEQLSDSEYVSKNSRKRKRKRNTISTPQNNSEEKKILQEPVFRYIDLTVDKIKGNPNRKKKKNKK